MFRRQLFRGSSDPMTAIGAIDCALWDLMGRKYGVSVSRLLGGFRRRLPTYASTYHGDRNGGLDSPQAYAEFAVRCKDCEEAREIAAQRERSLAQRRGSTSLFYDLQG